MLPGAWILKAEYNLLEKNLNEEYKRILAAAKTAAEEVEVAQKSEASASHIAVLVERHQKTSAALEIKRQECQEAFGEWLRHEQSQTDSDDQSSESGRKLAAASFT